MATGVNMMANDRMTHVLVDNNTALSNWVMSMLLGRVKMQEVGAFKSETWRAWQQLGQNSSDEGACILDIHYTGWHTKRRSDQYMQDDKQ